MIHENLDKPPSVPPLSRGLGGSEFDLFSQLITDCYIIEINYTYSQLLHLIGIFTMRHN
ncbi:hypothetical protein CWATWH0005_5227 [Crocosphaera watsonii WH 0005]|uniref:Uncharacterized protein n=1 Tax=Crocosphaera watsonii WH 0005 TaxID=423472 RepID=T2J0Q2_CROWT|nr:hypothetical protein CWATWH0005_5227 [Crocosphaera watsonii WH 0005]